MTSSFSPIDLVWIDVSITGLDVDTQGANGDVDSVDSSDDATSGEVADGIPNRKASKFPELSVFMVGSNTFGGELIASSISFSFDSSTVFEVIAKSVEYPDEWEVSAESGEPCAGVSLKVTFSSTSNSLVGEGFSSAIGAFCCCRNFARRFLNQT